MRHYADEYNFGVIGFAFACQRDALCDTPKKNDFFHLPFMMLTTAEDGTIVEIHQTTH